MDPYRNPMYPYVPPTPGMVFPFPPPMGFPPVLPGMPPVVQMPKVPPITSQQQSKQISTNTIQPAVNLQPLQIISVWIGKIGRDVSDEKIRLILDVIGSVHNWKRQPDIRTGKLKQFGFCEFTSVKAAIFAQNILNGLQISDSYVQVKVDEKTQKILNEAINEAGEATALIDPAEQEELKQKIAKITKSINEELGISQLDPNIAAEVIKKDDPKERERKRDAEMKAERIRNAKSLEEKRKEIDAKEYSRLEKELLMDQNILFDQLKEYRSYQDKINERLKIIEKQKKDFKTYSSSDEYLRKKEKENDEYEEILEKREEEKKRSRMRYEKRSGSSDDLKKKEFKENSSSSENNDKDKKKNEEKVAREGNDHDKYELDIDDYELLKGNPTPASIQIINDIPKDIECLYNYPIKYSSLFQHEFIDDKLKPFLNAKVREYLGQEETDFVNYIINLLKKKTAYDLVEILKPILDDEAQVFVTKLWRLVVFEMIRINDSEKRF